MVLANVGKLSAFAMASTSAKYIFIAFSKAGKKCLVLIISKGGAPNGVFHSSKNGLVSIATDASDEASLAVGLEIVCYSFLEQPVTKTASDNAVAEAITENFLYLYISFPCGVLIMFLFFKLILRLSILCLPVLFCYVISIFSIRFIEKNSIFIANFKE